MISIETIFLGAAIHGVALVFLLSFNSYANRTANILLAVLVGLLTLTMWNVFSGRSQDPYAIPIIDIYLWATPLLWAPVMFLYVGQLTGQTEITTRRVLLHSAPAIFTGLLQIPLHLFRDTEIGSMMIQVAYLAVIAFIYPQIAVYFFQSFRRLNAHQSNIKETHSTLDRINLTWLKTILIIFSAVLVADMSLNVPKAFFGMEMPGFYTAVLLSEASGVFAIGYLSLRQPEIISGISLEGAARPSCTSAKYLGSPIDVQLGAEMAKKLDRLMEDRKTYLQNDLTLAELADAIGLSPHHLSQVINQHRHKNFYDYVNEYRARYAADHLATHGKTNLTKLAFDAGFNNRVSFSKAFRKYTGHSPTSFTAEQKASQSS